MVLLVSYSVQNYYHAAEASAASIFSILNLLQLQAEIGVA